MGGGAHSSRVVYSRRWDRHARTYTTVCFYLFFSFQLFCEIVSPSEQGMTGGSGRVG